MKKLFIITAFLCFIITGYSQDTIRKFGIGIQVDEFGIAELELSRLVSKFTKVLLTYNHNSKFRIEPSFGFAPIIFDDEKNLAYHIGLGSSYLIKKEKTIVLLGGRISYDNIFIERLNYESYYNYPYETHITQKKEQCLSFGPTVSAEYLLGKHFSIAGEIGLFYLITSFKDNLSTKDTPDSNSSYIFFDKALLIRYYF